LNYDPEGIISKQLYKLKKISLYENSENQKKVIKLTKYVVVIHSQNIIPKKFKVYNAEWVIEQVYKIKDISYKNDIISALEIMSQVEIHNDIPKKNTFLAWDIIRSDWQENYQSGKVGSFVWDIASIITEVNNPKFSEMFLTNYLGHSGKKPTLMNLYANLYYVKVFEAIKNMDFENIMGITKEIINNAMFNTDVISYETLVKLNIIGY
jgi:aromatic ring-opening dioxygenase LigB subunit